MNLVGRLRSIRWIKRATLAFIALAALHSALLPCAMAAQMDSGVAKHCAYCPGDMEGSGGDSQSGRECHFLHAPTIDNTVYSLHASAHSESPLLQRVFQSPASRTRICPASINISPRPPNRPLTLTHCVQLK